MYADAPGVRDEDVGLEGSLGISGRFDGPVLSVHQRNVGIARQRQDVMSREATAGKLERIAHAQLAGQRQELRSQRTSLAVAQEQKSQQAGRHQEAEHRSS